MENAPCEKSQEKEITLATIIIYNHHLYNPSLGKGSDMMVVVSIAMQGGLLVPMIYPIVHPYISIILALEIILVLVYTIASSKNLYEGLEMQTLCTWHNRDGNVSYHYTIHYH